MQVHHLAQADGQPAVSAGTAYSRTGGPGNRAASRWVPGEVGIWAFLLTDMSVFGLYFITFFYERGLNPALFERGRDSLSLTHGAFNTFVLLTASLFIALALQSMRAAQVGSVRIKLLGAGACGLLFMASKALEWGGLASAGHVPAENHFFQLFFLSTGMHLVHVTMAMLVLGHLWRVSGHVKNAPTSRQLRHFECGALYWHMVDLLWLVLFAVLYLTH